MPDMICNEINRCSTGCHRDKRHSRAHHCTKPCDFIGGIKGATCVDYVEPEVIGMVEPINPQYEKEAKVEKKYEATDKEINRMTVLFALHNQGTWDSCEDARKYYREFDTKFSKNSVDAIIPYCDVPQYPGPILYDWLQSKPSEVLEWFVDKGFLKEKAEEVFYKQGDTFLKENDKFVLSQVAPGKFALIIFHGSDRGNRWQEPEEVRNSLRITKEEFEKITDNQVAEFEKIED